MSGRAFFAARPRFFGCPLPGGRPRRAGGVAGASGASATAGFSAAGFASGPATLSSAVFGAGAGAVAAVESPRDGRAVCDFEARAAFAMGIYLICGISWGAEVASAAVSGVLEPLGQGR
jgi:hypothetical protein